MEILVVTATLLLMTQVVAQLDEEEAQILDRCYDVIPPGSQHPCWLQKLWGKCDVDWMTKGQKCAKTCERCIVFQDCSCTNVPPINDVFIPCQQLAKDGYCDDSDFLQFNYCEYSCGQCKCPAAYITLSIPPPLPPPPPPPSIFIDPTPLVQNDFFVIYPNLQQQYQEQQTQQQRASASDYENSFSDVSVFVEEQAAILEAIFSPLEDNKQEKPQKCFSDLFIDNDCCTLMVSAIRAVGLDSMLDDYSTAPTTIFVPTDKAFDEAIDNGINITDLINIDPPDILRQLLGYHIIDGPRSVNDLRQQSQWNTFEKGWPIYVQITDDQRVLIRGQRGEAAQIKQSDLILQQDPDLQIQQLDNPNPPCQSVVQIITQVLIPEQLLPAYNPLYNAIPEMLQIDATTSYEFVQDYAEDVPNACTNESFADLEGQIASFGQTDVFWNWIVQNNLIPTIQQAAQNQPLTLFLPRNEAVLQYQIFLSSLQQQDPGTLNNILLQHIVPGVAVQSQNIDNTKNYQTLAQNQQVTILPGDPFAKIKADITANLIKPDVIESCNLSVHVIGEMLKVKEIFDEREQLINTQDAQNEADVQVCAENVFGAISQIPELSYVLQFMEDYKQAWFLRLNEMLTVFIPRQDDMQTLQQFANSLASSISSEADILRELLQYHIIPNQALRSLQEIRNKGVLETLSGDVLYPQGGAEQVVLMGNVNSAVIVNQQYNNQQQSCKIAVHVINNILQPVKFGQRYESDPFASVTVAGARVAGSSSFCQAQQISQSSISIAALDVSEVRNCIQPISNILQNTPQMDRITVLAPNNQACAELDTLLMQQSLQEDQRLLLREQILSYHLIPNVILTDDYLQTVEQDLQTLPTVNAVPISINKKFGNIYFEGIEGKARIVQPDIQLECNIVVHVVDDILIPFSQFPEMPMPSPPPYTVSLPQTLPLDTNLQSPLSYILPQQQSQDLDAVPQLLPLVDPPPQQISCTGMCCYAYDIIQNNPDLTTFKNIITLANLTQLFQNSIDVTVLAPRNDRMFEFLRSLNIPSFTDFPQQNLQRLVEYHVLEGVWPVRLLKDQLSLQSQLELEQGGKANVLFQSNWGQLFPEERTWFALGMLNNVTLVETDLESDCAIVHIIDYPLLVPDL